MKHHLELKPNAWLNLSLKDGFKWLSPLAHGALISDLPVIHVLSPNTLHTKFKTRQEQELNIYLDFFLN